MYAPEYKYTVYCTDCFSSDKWNPMDYGQDYDFPRIFEQIGELFKKFRAGTLYQILP